MDGWVLALIFLCICTLWWIIKLLFFETGESEYERWVKECFQKQARKRNGIVTLSVGWPVLTVPFKSASIEVSLVGSGEDTSGEFTRARFRTDIFNGKKFRVLLNSKNLVLKPFYVSSRLEVSDERFKGIYIVAGNDASFVNAILTQEIRDKLVAESLQAEFHCFRWGRKWLTVYRQGHFSTEQVVDELIETAILFHERLNAHAEQLSLPHHTPSADGIRHV